MYEEIEEVYLLYYPDLYRFLVKLCPDTAIVDDIIQNTFLEALKSIESFSGSSSLKTWLFSIAKHQLYRYLRKNKLQINIDQLSETEHATTTDVSDRLLAQEITETINNLPPPHNDILRLRLIHGLSFKEIGLHIHQTENYCRVNFYRTITKLRKEYKDANM